MPPRLNTRYQFCRAYKDDDERWYLEVPYAFRFSPEVDSTPHLVTEGDTLQILAYRYYRKMDHPAQLWRAIAEFNDIIDATLPLTVGMQLMIPSARWIRRVFLAPPSEFRMILADVQRTRRRM